MTDPRPPQRLRDDPTSAVGRLLKRLPPEEAPGANDEARAFARLEDALARPARTVPRWGLALAAGLVAVVAAALWSSGPSQAPTLVLAARGVQVGATLAPAARVELPKGSLLALSRDQSRVVLEADQAGRLEVETELSISASTRFAAEQIGGAAVVLTDSGQWELRLERGVAVGVVGGTVTVLEGSATLTAAGAKTHLVAPATFPAGTAAVRLSPVQAGLLRVGRAASGPMELRELTGTERVRVGGDELGSGPMRVLLPVGTQVERSAAAPARADGTIAEHDAANEAPGSVAPARADEASARSDTAPGHEDSTSARKEPGTTPETDAAHRQPLARADGAGAANDAASTGAGADRANATTDAGRTDGSIRPAGARKGSAPETADLRLDSAARLAAAGRTMEAARALEAIGAGQDPDASLALYQLGTLKLRKLRDPRGAAEVFRSSLRRFPADELAEDVEVSLIEALLASSAFTDAETEATRFLSRFEHSPQAPAIRLIRANVRREWGDCRAASEDYTVLQQGAGPVAADALYFLALCARRDGEKAAATRWLGELRSRFPDGPHRDDARALERP